MPLQDATNIKNNYAINFKRATKHRILNIKHFRVKLTL